MNGSVAGLPVGTVLRLRDVKNDTRTWQITRINQPTAGMSDGYLIRRRFVGTRSFFVPYRAVRELFEVKP